MHSSTRSRAESPGLLGSITVAVSCGAACTCTPASREHRAGGGVLSIEKLRAADQARGCRPSPRREPASSTCRHRGRPASSLPRRSGAGRRRWCSRRRVVQAFVAADLEDEAAAVAARRWIRIGRGEGGRLVEEHAVGRSPEADGTDGGSVSTVKLSVADHADWLPAASCRAGAPVVDAVGERSRRPRAGRPAAESAGRRARLHDARAAAVGADLERKAAAVAAVAGREGAAEIGPEPMWAPAAGPARLGIAGGFVSSTNRWVAVQAPWLPATSVPLSRQ